MNGTLGKIEKVTMSIVEGVSLLFADEERRYHSGNQREILIYVVSLATRGTTKLSAERAVIFGHVTSVRSVQ